MQILKLGTLLTLFVTIKSEPPIPSSFAVPPSTSYGEPFIETGPYPASQASYNHDQHSYDDHNSIEDNQPKSYEFGYAVKDDYSGNDYGRKESSDGNAVRGEYRVNLPDGRVQIVTYYADWQTGFHADVRYEGTAIYPEDLKTQYGPVAPSYSNPGPSYTNSKNIYSNNNHLHNDIQPIGYPSNTQYNTVIAPADISNINNLVSSDHKYDPSYDSYSNSASSYGYKLNNPTSSSFDKAGY